MDLEELSLKKMNKNVLSPKYIFPKIFLSWQFMLGKAEEMLQHLVRNGQWFFYKETKNENSENVMTMSVNKVTVKKLIVI